MQEISIFTRIINGEIPAYKVYEDDRVIAFLDVHPLSEGHTLVVPKVQIDHIWDLDMETYDYLWNTAHKIALRIREVINPVRVGVVVEGFGVPHTHIHLIPIYESNDLKKPQEKDKDIDHASLSATADRLRM